MQRHADGPFLHAKISAHLRSASPFNRDGAHDGAGPLRQARQSALDVEGLMSPQGFAGRDGVFRFLADGVAERGLSVQQVTITNATVISEAPSSFATTTN